MFIELVCIACVAVAMLAFTLWKVRAHGEEPLPVHKMEEWELAFEKWLHEHAHAGRR